MTQARFRRQRARQGRALTGIIVGMSAAVLLLGACGDPDDAPSSNPGGSGGSDGGMLAYAKCMRENGIKDFPDPNSSGRVDLDGNKIKMDSAQFKAADGKCKSLLPKGGEPQEPAAGNDAAKLKYSKCMRKNGVPKFPDPNAEGGIDINGDTLGVDPMGPVFKAADEKCKKHLAGGGERIEQIEPRGS